ncbi:MAG: sirohydrochlorin chelatase [Gemmataceae bacterium]
MDCRYPILQNTATEDRWSTTIPYETKLQPGQELPLMVTALLLIAHGSRNSEANEDLHHVADELKSRGHPIAVPSYLELAEPSIEEGGRLCVRQGANVVVMAPYFLSAGIHVRRDLTESRDNLQREFPEVKFLLADPMSRHPALVNIVEERIQEALDGTKPVSEHRPGPGMSDPVENSAAGLP